MSQGLKLSRSQGPRVPRSKGSKVQGSQGPRYLKLTFKYELDSKEGPSCYFYFFVMVIKLKMTRWTFFRVKLVFECEFEISWSLGPWDLGTPGPWNPWTSSLHQHLLILPLRSSYLLHPLPPTLLL